MEISSVQLAANYAAAAPAPERVSEQRELIRAVHALNATDLFGENRELSFAMDRDTKRPVIRIVDRDTREVIQQIPPEYALRLAEELFGR